jgi:hypothetical protein
VERNKNEKEKKDEKDEEDETERRGKIKSKPGDCDLAHLYSSD